MSEHVLVTYPEVRVVRVDRSPQSATGVQFQVSAGTKTFDLGAPVDYHPPSQTVTIRGTNPNAPHVIAFEPRAVTSASLIPEAAPALAGATVAPAPSTAPATLRVSADPSEALASQQSVIFHLSIACPDGAKIVGTNAVFGDDARAGRTLHEGCTG